MPHAHRVYTGQKVKQLTSGFSIEMNVIIIAACIPTLRPLFLVLFNQPGASHYRPSLLEKRSRSYQKTPDSKDSSGSSSHLSRGSTLFNIVGGKAFDGASPTAPGGNESGVHARKGSLIVSDRDIEMSPVEKGQGDFGISMQGGVGDGDSEALREVDSEPGGEDVR